VVLYLLSLGRLVLSVRVLTSVSTLGEVNLLYDEEIVNLCVDSDCALYYYIANKIYLIVERPRHNI